MKMAIFACTNKWTWLWVGYFNRPHPKYRLFFSWGWLGCNLTLQNHKPQMPRFGLIMCQLLFPGPRGKEWKGLRIGNHNAECIATGWISTILWLENTFFYKGKRLEIKYGAILAWTAIKLTDRPKKKTVNWAALLQLPIESRANFLFVVCCFSFTFFMISLRSSLFVEVYTVLRLMPFYIIRNLYFSML